MLHSLTRMCYPAIFIRRRMQKICVLHHFLDLLLFFCFFGGVFGTVAIVLGIVSLSRQRNQPDLEGQGLAIAGIILGVFPFLWGAYAMVIVLLAATAPR